MRRLFSVLLSVFLCGCAVTPYVELSGPGKQRAGKCEPGVNKQLGIDLAEGVHLYVTAAHDGNETYISTQYILSAYPRSARVLSTHANLSVEPGLVLISEVRYSDKGFANDYERSTGDKSEDIVIEGKSLLDLDLAYAGVFNINYLVPSFSGTSAQLVLPSMLINGKRIDIAPITMKKKLTVVTFCM